MDIWFFIITMALFAGVFIFLGYLGYRKTKTAEDYFVAGRTMGALLIAFSYGATFISAVALIGFSGIASVYGHSILWLAFLNVFVGIFIAGGLAPIGALGRTAGCADCSSGTIGTIRMPPRPVG